MLMNRIKSSLPQMKKDNSLMLSFMKNHSDTDKQSRIDLAILNYISKDKKLNPKDIAFADCDKEAVKKRKKEIKDYIAKLNDLKKIPLIKQRTPEWFELRSSRVTASVLDEVMKENNIKYAKKKAGVTKDTTNYSSIPALKWGVMFEPMATRCYSMSNDNINVHEFGLITNEDIKHFGASPDGINDMGVMIEIKCPYSRQIIDSSIPEKYFLQIQGQLAVCGLKECDYVECNFATFDTTDAYTQFVKENAGNTKHGIIAEFRNDSTGEYEYEYSPQNMDAQDAIDYMKQVVEDLQESRSFVKTTPWHLKEMNIQRVYFDEKRWCEDIVPKINKFWEKVEECKLLPEELPVVATKPKYAFIADD